MNTTRITRKTAEAILSAARPNLRLFESNGIKGFYVASLGPAFSFRGRGETWREVLTSLELI